MTAGLGAYLLFAMLVDEDSELAREMVWIMPMERPSATEWVVDEVVGILSANEDITALRVPDLR